MIMLRVEEISASYGNIKVLQQVNLQIQTGQIVTVLGANGAGKSTLLKTISGILKTNNGSIVFQGRDITNRSYVEIVKLGISHVPEGREIFPQLRVKENLLLGAYHRKNHREIEQDMEIIYGIFPILRKRGDQLAGTLSGGEQQMLAICRAFMARPKLLMLDSQGC